MAIHGLENRPRAKKKTGRFVVIFFVLAALTIGTIVFFTLRIPVQPLRVAFLYDTEPLESTAQYFGQPLIYHLEFSQVQAESGLALAPFDLIVVDASLVYAPAFSEIAANLYQYVTEGGRIAMTHRAQELLTHLKPEAADFLPFTPAQGIHVQEENPRFSHLGRIFSDYMRYFPRFAAYDSLSDQPAGLALALSPHVQPIVYTRDQSAAIAAMLKLGAGEIYYFGALLPDPFFATCFSFQDQDGERLYFNHTAAAADHLLWNTLASDVSKEVHGFSLWRVFGLNGRPSMAHQLHIEALPDLQNGQIEQWAEMAQNQGQIASFGLIKGFYEYFLRYESFGYALGNPDGSFQSDPTNDFYAWGTHIVHDGRWLHLAQSESRQSFFYAPQEATRAFPSVLDFNGDGIPDIIAGSSDGYFHLFQGISMGPALYPRWTVESLGRLNIAGGHLLHVEAFSAPTIYGTFEEGGFLVSGSLDGSLTIWDWYGGLTFGDSPTVIPPPPGETLSAPDVVDFTGSGTLDFIVGFASGRVYLYEGDLDFAPRRLLETGEQYAAPRAIDLTGDGSFDLVVGTHNGDLLRYFNQGGAFVYGGPLPVSPGAGPVNFKNTAGFNSGNNVTPLFVDLTGDGTLDLVWGLLEYGGFVVSIADELFPYRVELLSALETLEDMHVPVILHSYTHQFKAPEAEFIMLQAEMEALRAYGIDVPTGINQHSWRISQNSPMQTLFLQLNQGFLWNFGFRPSESPAHPFQSPEYGMITPFYLHGEDGARMLLFNANFRQDNYRTFARHNLPISLYITLHGTDMEAYFETVGEMQDARLYNFVTEPQLAQSIAAAMGTDVRVYVTLRDMAADFLRERTGRSPRFDRYLVIQHVDQDAPLFDARYADAIGLRMELGTQARPFLATTSPVRWFDGQATHFTLADTTGRGVRVWTRYDRPEETMHLISVNLPAEVRESPREIAIQFLEDGLQQIYLFAVNGVELQGEGFAIREVREHLYHISKTGPASALTIRQAEETGRTGP